jgi:tRNA A58 N-methylase Trm61
MSIGVGQISPNDPSGQTLMRYVVSNKLANIVDIGTWNGLGSTLCFLLALQGNMHTKLITLEINREKQEIAKTNLRNYVNGIDVNFVWGSVISSSEIVDIETVFPELAANAEYRRWHSIDVANIDASPNAISAIPERIDFVLFDGGEFTSYYDFVKLFPRCDKFIALDDINAPKCQLIRKVLLEHPDWTEIEHMQHRHGFALFQKKTA